MSKLTSAQRGASLARRILLGALAVGLLGALAALAAGDDLNGPLGKVGAVLVLGALFVAFVLTPIGFWLSIRSMRERWHVLTGRSVERPGVSPGDRDRSV